MSLNDSIKCVRSGPPAIFTAITRLCVPRASIKVKIINTNTITVLTKTEATVPKVVPKAVPI